MLVGWLILFVGASIGHTAILAYSNNWWFAHNLPHRFLSNLRLFHGLLIVAGIVAFALSYPGEQWDFAVWLGGSAARIVGHGYLLGCAAIGLIWVPYLTLYRLRRRPAVLLSNDSRSVDLACDLGYRPVGNGKYRLLTRFPGNQVFQVEFSERVLALPRLPREWDGLTVLHLSDFHFKGTPDKAFFQRVMDLSCQDVPDLVAFTGDAVDSDLHYRWVLPVFGRLRWRLGAFAILGNHDSWYEPLLVRRRLQRAGFRVVANSWEKLKVHGRTLVVVGQELPWFSPGPDLTACPADAFRLCLSHTPDHIGWAQTHQIDLMLAGHNHGGQIRFPVIGSVVVPSRFGRRYDCGTFFEPPTVLHVSRGLGAEHPIRYRCRPEVTRLVLRCGAAPR
jgi:uncharacterized protein